MSLRKRVLRRHYGENRLANPVDHVELRRRAKAEAEAHLGLATPDRLGHPVAARNHHVERHARMARAELVDCVRQEPGYERFNRGDPHVAPSQTLQRVELGVHALYLEAGIAKIAI